MPNIKVIIAHELGHLLSQSVIHFNIPKYKTIAYEIEYVGNPHYPWTGGVVNNLDQLVARGIQYEIIIRKFKWFVYELFTLCAGCIIQNIYEQKKQKSSITFNECFSLSSTSLGSNDYYKYHDIISLFLDRNHLRGKSQVVNYILDILMKFGQLVKQLY